MRGKQCLKNATCISLLCFINDINRAGEMGRLVCKKTCMANMQARFMSEIPVFMSSLLQAPMIGAAYKNMERILVLAPEASKLEAMRDVMLKDSGFDIDNTERFVLRDFHGCQEFMMYQGNQKIDAVELESAIVKHVQAILEQNDVRSIVLTSTSALPFSDAIRKATAKPVFDHITCMEFFQKVLQL